MTTPGRKGAAPPASRAGAVRVVFIGRCGPGCSQASQHQHLHLGKVGPPPRRSADVARDPGAAAWIMEWVDRWMGSVHKTAGWSHIHACTSLTARGRPPAWRCRERACTQSATSPPAVTVAARAAEAASALAAPAAVAAPLALSAAPYLAAVVDRLSTPLLIRPAGQSMRSGVACVCMR